MHACFNGNYCDFTYLKNNNKRPDNVKKSSTDFLH